MSAPRKSAASEAAPQTEEQDEQDVFDKLDAHLPAQPRVTSAIPRTLVGLVTDDRHPTLVGRVRVQWTDAAGQSAERWLPALHGLSIRTHDRVLVQKADNFEEPIVTGVIDGFATRPEQSKTAAATVEVKPDEVVRIDSSEGKPLLEIHASENGPVLKLVNEDVALEVPGKFRVAAKSIQLEAKLGEVRVTAHDDVVVLGENVKLN